LESPAPAEMAEAGETVFPTNYLINGNDNDKRKVLKAFQEAGYYWGNSEPIEGHLKNKTIKFFTIDADNKLFFSSENQKTTAKERKCKIISAEDYLSLL
jgi:hypothetical protein